MIEPIKLLFGSVIPNLFDFVLEVLLDLFLEFGSVDQELLISCILFPVFLLAHTSHELRRLNIGQFLHGILVLLSHLGNLHVDCASGSYSQNVGSHSGKVVIKLFGLVLVELLVRPSHGIQSRLILLVSDFAVSFLESKAFPGSILSCLVELSFILHPDSYARGLECCLEPEIVFPDLLHGFRVLQSNLQSLIGNGLLSLPVGYCSLKSQVGNCGSFILDCPEQFLVSTFQVIEFLFGFLVFVQASGPRVELFLLGCNHLLQGVELIHCSHLSLTSCIHFNLAELVGCFKLSFGDLFRRGMIGFEIFYFSLAPDLLGFGQSISFSLDLIQYVCGGFGSSVVCLHCPCCSLLSFRITVKCVRKSNHSSYQSAHCRCHQHNRIGS